MRAGLLARYKAEAFKEATTQSSITGAMKKSRTSLGEFRFFRQTRKEQSAVLGNAEAMQGTIILQYRRSQRTEAMTHFKYDGNLYRVEQPILNPEDQTYTATATLVKE